MGNCRSSASVVPRREATLLMLGLDNSGKTTLVANLNGESTEGTTPSIGFSSSTLEMDDFKLTLYDLGGGVRLRNIWKNYFSEAWGCIFVVDGSDINRLTDAKEALNSVVLHEKMKGKPLLVYANKQDCDGAVGEDQVSQQLELADTLGEHKRLSHVLKCTALRSASRNRSDPSIRLGVKWLLGQIQRDYQTLSERVGADMAEQKAMEARKKRERAERVKKIKEERERLRRLAGVADEGEEEEGTDGPPGDNPFKPIQQAAVETEARERAAKARSKEIQNRLSEQGASGDPDRGDGGGIDGRSQSSSGLSSSSDSLTDVTPASHASSESLHSSVQPPLPMDPVVVIQTGPLPTTTDPTSQVSVDKGSKKKGRRSTLLTRLKNRSKTAPMPVSSDQSPNAQTTTAPYPLTQPAHVSRDTWTAAELERVSPTDDKQLSTSDLVSPVVEEIQTLTLAPGPLKPVPPPAVMSRPKGPTPPSGDAQPPMTCEQHPVLGVGTASANPFTSSSSSLRKASLPSLSSPSLSLDNMQGLPDLPPKSRVILPPLQITKQPVGMTEDVLHTEEEIAAIPKEAIIQLSEPPSLPVAVQPLSS